MVVKRVQAVVSGRVQGVGYRYFATHVAQQLGLVGTVRNTYDGHIEAVAEGDEAALTQFLSELRKGPTKADVTGMFTNWAEPEGSFTDFEAVA